MKRALFLMTFVCLFCLFSPGCSGKDSNEAESLPTGPGEEVVFSKDLSIPLWPQSVIPYGAGTDITLSGLENGSVKFTRRSDRKFELVVCYRTENHLLITVYGEERRHIFVAPPGQNGNVAFTLSGYKLSDDKSGTIRFSFPNTMYGMYDVAGDSAKVYAFCIPVENDDREVSQTPEPFQAISNVVEVEMKL